MIVWRVLPCILWLEPHDQCCCLDLTMLPEFACWVAGAPDNGIVLWAGGYLMVAGRGHYGRSDWADERWGHHFNISSPLQAEMGGVRVNSPHEFRNHQEFISAAHLASSQIRETSLPHLPLILSGEVRQRACCLHGSGPGQIWLWDFQDILFIILIIYIFLVVLL